MNALLTGYYLYIETSAPRLSGDVARIYSPFISSSYPADCLVFHYHMFGEHVAHLKALIKTIEGHEQYVWKSFGNHGDTWHKATIHIPPMQTDYQVGLHNDIPSFFKLFLGDYTTCTFILLETSKITSWRASIYRAFLTSGKTSLHVKVHDSPIFINIEINIVIDNLLRYEINCIRYYKKYTIEQKFIF